MACWQIPLAMEVLVAGDIIYKWRTFRCVWLLDGPGWSWMVSISPYFGWLKSVKILIVDSEIPIIHSTTDDLSWLVVEPPLWKIWKSVGHIIPNIWKKQCSKPPTRPSEPLGLLLVSCPPCCRPPGLSTSPTSWSCQVWQKSLGNGGPGCSHVGEFLW